MTNFTRSKPTLFKTQTMLISVIIAVYNKEDYLDDCIQSCLSQKINDDVEFIFINDGSTDSSLTLLQKYQEIDPRVRTYTRKNKGLSPTRHEGVFLAKGKYIMFLDADDILCANTLQTLTKTISEHSPKIIMCPWNSIESGYQLEQGSQGMTPPDQKQLKSYGEAKVINAGNTSSFFDIPQISWNKIFLRDYWIQNDLRFLPVFESLYLMYQLSVLESEILLIKEPLYAYRLNVEGSVSHSSQVKMKYFRIFMVTDIIKDYLLAEKAYHKFGHFFEEHCYDLWYYILPNVPTEDKTLFKNKMQSRITEFKYLKSEKDFIHINETRNDEFHLIKPRLTSIKKLLAKIK